MSRLQSDDLQAPGAPHADWRHGGDAPDCWAEMQTEVAQGGHAAWASLASQRPAAEERLSRLVDTIERDIIPRLVRAHTSSAAADTGPVVAPGRDDVVAFGAHVMARDDTAIDAQLAALRARGVSVESLYVDLLSPVARHLGELWDDDRCHFADVTVGLGRLQQIMRGLSSAFGTEIDPPPGGRRVLLMPAPGEQHTFGLSMVAEFFARAGWEVVGVMDPMSNHFEDRVKNEWFDLVGISAGNSTRLDGIAACIAAVRKHSHNRAVAVMVGGPLFTVQPELVERLGADGMATDGRQAPVLAERLLARRVKGL